VVVLVRHLVSAKNQVHLVSQEAQHQLLEHSVLHQLSVRSLPLDSPLREDSVSHLLWEPNQIPLDSQQHRQVASDSHRQWVKVARSDSLLVHLKQVPLLRRDKATKRRRRLSDKLHGKEEEGSARLQHSVNHRLLVSNKILLLGSPLAWVSNLSQHLVSPQHLLSRIQHLVSPQCLINRTQRSVNPQSRVRTRHSIRIQRPPQMEHLDSVNQQQTDNRQRLHNKPMDLGSPQPQRSNRTLSASLHRLHKHTGTSNHSHPLHKPQLSRLRSDSRHSLRTTRPLAVASERRPRHNRNSSSSSSKIRTQSLYPRVTG